MKTNTREETRVHNPKIWREVVYTKNLDCSKGVRVFSVISVYDGAVYIAHHTIMKDGKQFGNQNTIRPSYDFVVWNEKSGTRGFKTYDEAKIALEKAYKRFNK
jgi:hypothetical protein